MEMALEDGSGAAVALEDGGSAEALGGGIGGGGNSKISYLVK